MPKKTTEILLGEGWALTASAEPKHNQYVVCLRNGFSAALILCVYDAETKNFYQVFHRISKRRTTLELTIVRDIAAFQPVCGVNLTEDGEDA